MVKQYRERLRHEENIERKAIDGGTVQWLVDRELGAEHLMAYRLTVDLDSMASHVHLGSEEASYLLEGNGEVRVEQSIHSVRGAQAVFGPDSATQRSDSAGTA